MPQNPVFELEFEEVVEGFYISKVGAYSTPICILNEGSAQGSPRTIIRKDQNWSVRFLWRTGGSTSELLTNDWNLSIYLVRVNGTVPLHISRHKVVKHVPRNPYDYNESIVVPAGQIKDGLYKLYTNVDVVIPGDARAKISGFGEGPMMEFYTPS